MFRESFPQENGTDGDLEVHTTFPKPRRLVTLAGGLV